MLLLVLIFVVPALINVDRYRPSAIAYLQEKMESRSKSGGWHSRFFPYRFTLTISV